MIGNIIPPVYESGCALEGSGISWIPTIIFNIPKLLLLILVILAVIAFKNRWEKFYKLLISILIVLSAFSIIYIPVIFLGKYPSGWEWLWLNLPLYGCM